MKKFIKLISCGAATVALIFSAQICAMAAVVSDVNQANSPAASIPATAVSLPENYNAVSGVQSGIDPYDNAGTINPRTGVQNLAIPGVVAMIAAAAAAVTLTGKKK